MVVGVRWRYDTKMQYHYIMVWNPAAFIYLCASGSPCWSFKVEVPDECVNLYACSKSSWGRFPTIRRQKLIVYTVMSPYADLGANKTLKA